MVRNIIIHGYSQVDKDIFKDIIKDDIPHLSKIIKEQVQQEVLDDPYQLYEIEYEDLISRADAKMSYDEIDKDINKINDCGCGISND